MITTRPFGPLVFAVLSAISACTCQERASQKPSEADIPVVVIHSRSATVSDPLATISLAEYRHELARARMEREETLLAAPLPESLRTSLLDMLIEERIILLEADRLNVRASTVAIAREIAILKAQRTETELKTRLIDSFQTLADLEEAIARRFRIAKLMNGVRKRVKVTDEEIIAAWNAMKPEEKLRPARVHASQIVVPTEEEGDAIEKRLTKGEDFEAIARASSIGPESVRGGDLGWFERGTMPTIFDEVCFSLEPGQTSHLNPSEYGFHIFRIHAKEPERALTLEEARPDLERRVLAAKTIAAENQYLERLRARVQVEKHEQILGRIE